MKEILQKEAEILRGIAKDVAQSEILSPRIRGVLEDMKEALKREPDGVAIAAPQIGEPLRIFVISGRILKKTFGRDDESVIEGDDADHPDMVFINPEITNSSKKTALLEEGCLSVRWLYGKVKRSKKITIRAYDENGRLFTRGASGLLAQIFQHETDHLKGILFTDKAKDIREVLPE